MNELRRIPVWVMMAAVTAFLTGVLIAAVRLIAAVVDVDDEFEDEFGD